MKHCPQCGKVLPDEQIKFCPECGFSLTQTRDFDIICPDCNTIITDENSECPNCGCPSEMFIKRKKTQHAHYEILECPDCGKVFEETIPNECPNCGCPSDKFIQHIEAKNGNNTPKKVNKNILATLIILFIFASIGSGTYYIIRQQVTEKMRQEQYARERAIKEEEDRKRQEEIRIQEQQNIRRLQALCKNKWNYRHGDYYGQSILESVGFQKDGTGWCSMTYYAGGNRIRTSSFDFTYKINGDYIYIDGDKAFNYSGGVLKDMEGHRYSEVSRISF